MVEEISMSKAFLTTNIAPAEAPNANTRALAASIDFSNSEAEALILPRGCCILLTLIPRMLYVRLITLLIAFCRSPGLNATDNVKSAIKCLFPKVITLFS